MYKMNLSITIILIFIHLSLSELNREDTYKNDAKILIYDKPKEAFPSYYKDQITRQQLEVTGLHFNQLPSDKKTQELFRRTSKSERSLSSIRLLSNGSFMELCGKTSNKFNKINNVSLSMLCKRQSKTFNALKHHRLARSIIKRESPCPLLKGKLKDDTDEINEVILQVSSVSDTCPFSKMDSNNCRQWLILMQCATNSLSRGIKLATSSGARVEQINQWEIVYKKVIFKYEQYAEVARASLSNELKEEFDSLRVQLQAAKRVISDVQRGFRNIQIKNCIENISNRSFENAIKYFQQLKKNSALIDITKVAYTDYGKLENVKNIIDFGIALPKCSQNMIVFVTLYELIKENNQLNSPVLLIFYKATNRCMKNSSIETSLKIITQRIIESWSDKIRSSNYSDIIRFLKVNNQGHDIRDYYPEIIEKGYSHCSDNTRAILKFIREIPFIEEECICLSALFENMKNNNHLFTSEVLQVAFRLKEIMEAESYLNLEEYFQNLAVRLKKSFYSSVQNLIWYGVNCTIKCKDYDEYLYSPDNGQKRDSERRKVYTWRYKGIKVFDEAYWTISPHQNAEYFTLKSNKNNEYLYAAAAEFAHDNDRRSVFTWIPGTSSIEGYWILTPLNDGEDFVIYNKHFREYFYAPNDNFLEDSERRRVFTWRKEAQIASDITWKINCKRFSF